MANMASDLPPHMPYYERLKTLRQRTGMTQLQLRDRILELADEGTVTLPEAHRVKGARPDPYESIKRAEMSPRTSAVNGGRAATRRPSREMLAAFAAALGVPPEEFAEYRLAEARRQLDEREVGLDEALANLERYALVSSDTPRSAAQAALAEGERLAREAAQQLDEPAPATGTSRRARGARGSRS